MLLSEALGEGETEDVVQLLADLREIFNDAGDGILPSKEIVKRLSRMEDRPWSEWSNGRRIKPVQLASLLKPFKITPRQARLHGVENPVRGYRREDFERTWQAY